MTRDLQTFNDLGEISYLYQYLWMDKNNTITFNNGLADLTIRMKDNYFITVKNGNYSDLGETSYMDMLYPGNLMWIIDYLKHQDGLGFKNKWEEIKAWVISSRILSKDKR